VLGVLGVLGVSELEGTVVLVGVPEIRPRVTVVGSLVTIRVVVDGGMGDEVAAVREKTP